MMSACAGWLLIVFVSSLGIRGDLVGRRYVGRRRRLTEFTHSKTDYA
jgi:hypothetical protein